jgi:hypothetical protein
MLSSSRVADVDADATLDDVAIWILKLCLKRKSRIVMPSAATAAHVVAVTALALTLTWRLCCGLGCSDGDG